MINALAEAKASLKEGNHGFGAVIIQGDRLIARAHDREATESDPTSHAELNAIRSAAGLIGRDLDDCTLISTHEPCPMCAAAIVWSGIKTLVYGYSITEAIAQGRKRIDLTCRELFDRTGAKIDIHEGVLHDQCALFYRKDVRDEIKRLRGATPEQLELLRESLTRKRMDWYQKNRHGLGLDSDDLLGSGYRLLLAKLEISPEEAPAVSRTPDRIVFHSQNFCPTLEACRILDLDTREICRAVNEQPTDALVKQFNDRLQFGRNYEKLRPHCEYCEEMVILKDVQVN